MASKQKGDLLNMITTKLNSFFGEISYRNYQFENATQSKKIEEDRKTKLLRKAFRMYKKKQISLIAFDLTEKQKERLILKSWDRLSDDEKLKYSSGQAPLVKTLQKKVKKKKEDEPFRPGE